MRSSFKTGFAGGPFVCSLPGGGGEGSGLLGLIGGERGDRSVASELEPVIGEA